MAQMSMARLLAEKIHVVRTIGRDLVFIVRGHGDQVYRYVYVTNTMQWVQKGATLTTSLGEDDFEPCSSKFSGIVALLATLESVNR
jgi:hypothetical protein